MLMASAQRCVDNQCCRCVLPCPDYKTPISGECSDLTVWYVGICDGYIADLFCLHCNIRLGNTTISLFFCALKLFFDFFVRSVENTTISLFFCALKLFFDFFLRSVGHKALYKLNFQNRQHWKCLIPRGPFKETPCGGNFQFCQFWKFTSYEAIKPTDPG